VGITPLILAGANAWISSRHHVGILKSQLAAHYAQNTVLTFFICVTHGCVTKSKDVIRPATM